MRGVSYFGQVGCKVLAISSEAHASIWPRAGARSEDGTAERGRRGGGSDGRRALPWQRGTMREGSLLIKVASRILAIRLFGETEGPEF